MMDYSAARDTMQVLYETEFGIHDHRQKDKNPLASVLHHPSEEVWLNSSLRETIEEFAVYNLGELFNISLNEYLQLPRPYIQLIREIKDTVLKKRDAIVKAVEQDVVRNKK